MSMTNAVHSAAKTPARLNIDNIVGSWSPVDTNGNDKMKVRSLNGNTRPLRGGDWTVALESLMTLSVAWTEHGDKQYGLTVAHGFLRQGVGDSVFAFNSDDKIVSTIDGGKAHEIIKIGTIKSIDIATDSLVFEIFPSIKIDPLAVALSGGDDQVRKVVLPKPFASRAFSLPLEKRLVMFGANRRGMIGCRVEPSVGMPRTAIISNNSSTQSYVTKEDGQRAIDGKTKLTFSGDCGALYLDEDGTPWCMDTTLHGIPRDSPTVWTSHGALLQDIVDAHPFYFGHVPPINGAASDLLSSSESQASPANPARLQDCIVKIMLEKIISPGPTTEQYPRIYFPDEQDCFIEYQPALPISCIRCVFPDDDDDDDGTVSTRESGGVEEEKKSEDLSEELPFCLLHC